MTNPDAIVIGSGPAGLAAAISLRQGGASSVLILDRDDSAGGLPRFCAHPGFGWEYTRRLEGGPRFVARLLAQLETDAVRIATSTTAIAVHPGPEVEIVGPRFGHTRIAAPVVVLATGARERPRSARLVPGRRPEFGVLNTGQLQQMVARRIPTGVKRAVVVGSEHVAFSVLATARKAGISIAAILEDGARIRSYPPAEWLARLLGTRILLKTRIEEILGRERVEGVVVRCPTGTLTVPCEMVVFTGEFVPDSVLARDSGLMIDPATAGPIVDQYGRTSVPGVFAAGNLLRAIESSGWSAIEGARIGLAAARHLRSAGRWRPSGATLTNGRGVSYVVPQIWADDEIGSFLPISLRASLDHNRAQIRIVRNDEVEWRGRMQSMRIGRRLPISSDTIDALARRGGEIRIDIA